MATLQSNHLEDLAGWQRLGVNNLNLGNGSVGDRINTIATSGDHDQIGTVALNHYLNAARSDYDKGKLVSEDDVIKQAAQHQNKSPKYVQDIVNCYNTKKPQSAPSMLKA
ncbi:hypothetical protein [Rugosimonospora africana]|uniref:Uncharacterized protein n=1 Tax=Rugosimonospora africana TaxID=556532 RepID=A0A8J3R5N1_9ACTN|nr:hypothetical protein [Rugosimonospora africana]GIH20466.1 hypothetical protein Raf01_86380 [Rugosimonospora africana]